MVENKQAHIIVVPFLVQGHINPMLQFSKRLAFKGIKPTLATTKYTFKSMHTSTTQAQNDPSIQIRPISDGYDDGGYMQADSAVAYFDSLRNYGRKTLAQLIKNLEEEGDPVNAVIYDGLLPWAFDVAKQFRLVGALFLTQSCSISSVYYHVQCGLIQLPLLGPGPSTVLVPGVPELQPSEAPSFVYKYGSYPFWLDIYLEQFSCIDQVDWVLCNSFYKMEEEVVDWMTKKWKVKTIGPTVPSYYLDKRLKDDKDYDMHLLKPNTTLCKNWLDTKPKDSVVYVSSGSTSDNQHFLWVVRESESNKLPKGFVQDTLEQGLVVGWAFQLEVLAHEATGCFVTHCGFNSILEALSLGVAMVGVPQWTDQGTNAKFVEDVWGVGVRAKVDEKDVVRRDELEECIKEIVMEGEKREEIMKNVAKWKKLAKEAIDEGGSSDNNIDEFVSYLMKC
ncbi:UDP-glycosyltransferase 74G1 [Bienertia sinuspersici]